MKDPLCTTVDVLTDDGRHLTRQKCSVWSRTMGYFRPVDSWNDGKKSEFYSRKYFTQIGGNSIFNLKYGN